MNKALHEQAGWRGLYSRERERRELVALRAELRAMVEEEETIARELDERLGLALFLLHVKQMPEGIYEYLRNTIDGNLSNDTIDAAITAYGQRVCI